MATMSNLTEANVGALKEAFAEKIAAVNPDAKLNVYEEASVQERLSVLENKVDSIANKLVLIFGDAVLLNGRFVSVGASGLAKKE
jgi:hypothetical protein